VLTRLHLRQPAVASIRARRGARQKLDLIMCLLGQRDANGSLFIAVVDAGHGTLPLLSEVPPDWAQHRLGLAQDEATLAGNFMCSSCCPATQIGAGKTSNTNPRSGV
jgi:hypothetical protein